MKKLILLSLAVLVGCSTPSTRTDKPAATPSETSDLSLTDAKDRKARLSEVRYDLAIQLNDTDLKFSGINTITFQLRDTSKPLRVDFFEGEVTKLEVNGVTVAPATAKRRYQIDLPAETLKDGANSVIIAFRQDYSRQGAGIHRFQDPETKEVFTYSDFEPYDANRFFPCFDQPDLRASLKLQVEAPAKWIVIANEKESKITTNGDRKTWSFPSTPPIATYIFAMHAGPYKVWRDEVDGIPLRVLARPTMAKYVRAKEFLTVTKQGFRFFNEFFGVKYPFKKYDQIFVPEFNSGAMENVAAVTFNESYLHRSTPTRTQRRSLAEVTLHEMAHMWFGNLVTMAWWNDLWLNESFATVMATIALHGATEFKEAWQDFFADYKSWAYWEDSLVTTHPIEAPVQNVKDAFAIFDGITYGKGASVLKQLRYYIGDAKFKAGIQTYMKTHAYQNTELKDFIAALQTQTDKDLSAWADVWLRQSGTDGLKASWKCEGTRLKEVALTVRPTNGTRFRPQSVQLGLFAKSSGGLKRTGFTRVDIVSPEQTVKGDWACPEFIYPNDEDFGFYSVSLDDRSLEFASASLMTVKDRLMRSMIWKNLWDMVRNGEMPLKQYVQIADTQLPHESDLIILGSVIGNLTGGRGTALQYWPSSDAAGLAQFIERYEGVFLARMEKEKAGSDLQKFWFDSFVGLARTPKALEQLKKWSTAKDINSAFPLDPDRRWGIVRQLSRFAPESPASVIQELKKTDASDRGVRSALAAEAVQPIAEIKKKWMSELTQEKPKLSLTEARAVMSSLFPLEQSAMVRTHKDQFYSYLRLRAQPEHDTYMRQYASRLTPLNCDPELSTNLRQFIDRSTLTPAVTKALKVNLQEDERCQMVRAKSGR